ncbi:MAG TPA: hypothetical protein VLI93_06010 [Acetobacteraceae bacterium]|nr:hypothetical protein [Acetobacteraceae bacterium]
MRSLIPISVIMLGICIGAGFGGPANHRSAIAIPASPEPGNSIGAVTLDRLTASGFPREW